MREPRILSSLISHARAGGHHNHSAALCRAHCNTFTTVRQSLACSQTTYNCRMHPAWQDSGTPEKLLYPLPVDITHVDAEIRPHCQLVRPIHLPVITPKRSPLRQKVPIEIENQDAAALPRTWLPVAAICHIQQVVWPNLYGPWPAQRIVLPLGDETPIGIEYLNARVLSIGNIHPARRI